MKVHSVSEDGKTIRINLGDGALLAIYHNPMVTGEIELQFAGVEDNGVTLTAPPFKGEPLKTLYTVFARYTPSPDSPLKEKSPTT